MCDQINGWDPMWMLREILEDLEGHARFHGAEEAKAVIRENGHWRVTLTVGSVTDLVQVDPYTSCAAHMDGLIPCLMDGIEGQIRSIKRIIEFMRTDQEQG